MGDTFTLPSGARVDVDRPDFAICRDADDLMELKYALSEKIIEIELQIDLHESALCNSQPVGLEKAWDWLPRAKAALKWAKLYRDEAQNRQGRMVNVERQRRHMETERAALDVLKEALPQHHFLALMQAAEALSAARIEGQWQLNGQSGRDLSQKL